LINEVSQLTNLHRRSVSRIWKSYKDSLSVERREGSGRKPGPSDKKLAQKIMRSYKNNPGLSLRDCGKKYQTSHENVRRTLLRSGYKSYIAKKNPNRDDNKSLIAKKRARLLYENVLTIFDGCILMDDETYVKCDFRQIPGQKFYYSTMRGNVPKKYKSILVDKFAKKYLVWQGICSCGLKTKAFLTSANINSGLYQKSAWKKEFCLSFVSIMFL
jgi:hypothetical protein